MEKATKAMCPDRPRRPTTHTKERRSHPLEKTHGRRPPSFWNFPSTAKYRVRSTECGTYGVHTEYIRTHPARVRRWHRLRGAAGTASVLLHRTRTHPVRTSYTAGPTDAARTAPPEIKGPALHAATVTPPGPAAPFAYWTATADRRTSRVRSQI